MAAEPTATKQRRIRRLPDHAKREILDAAEELLSKRPFRDLSVDELMARTSMTRSSFYHYFRSLDEVAIALMQRVQGEMMEAASPWLQLDYEGDPAAGCTNGIRASAEVFARHGRVLAAIHEASFHYEAVQRAWRHGILEDWIHAITSQLRKQQERGATRVTDPEAIAHALLLMNTAVFVERLGKQPPDPPEVVAETLAEIWVGALYAGFY
ncbi:MAG TPA: TetR/AcrR family transcriptional regulator [Candidatus Dormibacteraeota bacterium]|nr:TetR/AcrR family transcriptional regulator [Candidatus Dormibacteraeota bacterium]